MKHKIKVLNWNQADSDNDLFVRESVKMPLSVPVAIDFDPSRIIAKASIKKQSSGLFAEFETEKHIIGLYPAIGYEEIYSTVNTETGIKTISEIKLRWIGLSLKPNIDNTIKPII